MSDDPTDLDALRLPGLHEVTAKDPSEKAVQLAGDLGGELVTSDQIEATIARRRAREPSPVRQLLERRAAAGSADRVRLVGDIDALGALARGLVRADRIVAGTDANMVDAVGQRVSGGGISVHPDSIRSAASELVEARAAVAASSEQLSELKDAAMDSMIESGAEERAAAVVEKPEVRSTGTLGRSGKRRIAGVVLMSVGVAVVLGGLLFAVAGPFAVVVLVLPIVAIWWAIRTARADISDLDGKDAASDNLAQISARTDEVFGAGRVEEVASSGIPASVGAQLQSAESQLELAQERLRSATSNWSELAGGDADPADVDRVLRERDPQYFAAVDMVSQTSQARAARAHLRRVRARWNVAWGVLGEEPPIAAVAEDAVRELASAGVRAVKINTRIGSPADREAAQRALATLDEGAEAGPLVLTGISEDLSDDAIDALADLANSTSIVLVSLAKG
jgi:hypothetical protein